MAVLKIKDSNGKWTDVPFITPNMPTKVSDLDNDLNYQTKEQVEELIPNVDNLVTTEELNNGLNTKQPKGDYATNSRVNQVENSIPTQVSELQNDSNYATQTQVMQAIASIPQFSISLVESLPTTGAKMVLYLVSKGGESPDVYDEYIWIEQTSSFEFLGTTAVDLTGYVKDTDYATSSSAGVSKVSYNYGIYSTSSGILYVDKASANAINAKTDNYHAIVPSNLDNAVKVGITTNTNELTDTEKTNAQAWLGLDDVVRTTNYATSSKAGLMRPANGLYMSGTTGAVVIAKASEAQISAKKDNYYPIVSSTVNYAVNSVFPTMTQAEYDSLATKDEDLFYVIVEG